MNFASSLLSSNSLVSLSSFSRAPSFASKQSNDAAGTASPASLGGNNGRPPSANLLANISRQLSQTVQQLNPANNSIQTLPTGVSSFTATESYTVQVSSAGSYLSYQSSAEYSFPNTQDSAIEINSTNSQTLQIDTAPITNAVILNEPAPNTDQTAQQAADSILSKIDVALAELSANGEPAEKLDAALDTAFREYLIARNQNYASLKASGNYTDEARQQLTGTSNLVFQGVAELKELYIGSATPAAAQPQIIDDGGILLTLNEPFSDSTASQTPSSDTPGPELPESDILPSIETTTATPAETNIAETTAVETTAVETTAVEPIAVAPSTIEPPILVAQQTAVDSAATTATTTANNQTTNTTEDPDPVPVPNQNNSNTTTVSLTNNVSYQASSSVAENPPSNGVHADPHNRVASIQNSIINEQSINLQIKTNDGDIITLSLNTSSNFASQQTLGRHSFGSNDNSSPVFSLESNSAFNVTISGELDEGELAALNQLLDQVSNLASVFQSGDIANTFELAQNLDLDSSELISLSLNITHSKTTTATYERVDSYGHERGHGHQHGHNNGGQENQLVKLGNYLNGLSSALENAAQFNQPQQLLSDLFSAYLANQELESTSAQPIAAESLLSTNDQILETLIT
ncbi:MAG: hypothetical protein KUG79_00245 [Pseudomonadales bacterium]|nr:hypothetical protein [Pseudomonadales bacterium]